VVPGALSYVNDSLPGIRRRRRGRGFGYVADRGAVRECDRTRIAGLAIPPAWSDVWICADENGHIQATGRDAKGRKQYRYHQRWRQQRDRDKYERLREFGMALPELRAHVSDELEVSGAMTRDRVVALVLALLDETLIRVGNTEYLANGSFGLTTLAQRHVSWGRGSITFKFRGKGKIEHEVDVDDPQIARLVRRCHQLGGQHLFTYRLDGSDDPVPVSSTDVNDRLRDVTGLDVSAKDFRTWGGTVIVTECLASSSSEATDDAVLAAIDEAAARLGNTRAVCRSSYVHPEVVEAARAGTLQEIWAGVRARKHLRRAEVTLLDVVDGK
jgi:DNA topoisomerase I